ncbi:MAG: hypothetical protein ACRENE_23485 [Polyangiaceae bacterium]
MGLPRSMMFDDADSPKKKKRKPALSKPRGERVQGQITLRLQPDLEIWLRKKADVEQRANPGASVSLADVVRTLLYKAKATEEAGNG